MLTDKEIKVQFKKKTSENPEKYYAVSVLNEEGFIRKQCKKCGIFYWAIDSDICGNSSCSGGFRFIGKSPAKNKMSYVETWKKFSRMFENFGYTPIKRYPVVARWRDDTDFVQASIYDFQPYVVSGEISPPANPLVVPQFSLRFNDIDNVGITGAHYTGFVMIGQHAFTPNDKFNQIKYFKDIYAWLRKGLGLAKEEITFHEDVWAGGGNFGPCMEYFSRGLELGNQVYMFYEITPTGIKELNLRVLDMGMGHERNAWFSQGKTTSYETTFPNVIKKLKQITGIKIDDELISRFLPYASYLNIDEVMDINYTWRGVAEKTGYDISELKQKILPLAALYSIAEHSRTLLFAITDGALPSNVSGGYNLRVVLRRALSFIDKYSWNIDLTDICALHAAYLKPLFPELVENLDEVNKILEVEKNKYNTTKQKIKQIIEKIVEKGTTEKKLLELYDSKGIAPELVADEAKRLKKKIKIPENFYSKVAELHEKKKKKSAAEEKEKLPLENIKETKALYFDDYKKTRFKAKVLKIIDKNVILDKTAFYPTSGGQENDTGTIDESKVADVFKQGSIIIHVLKDKPGFKEGQEVSCNIDFVRRKQLTQHHTSTHIINAATRRILGKHINQAGAKKTMQKAQIDVTHYQSISNDEAERIEAEANKIVKEVVPVYSKFMPRNKAEKEYGMSIYQGGAVPGKDIRIVEIPEVDVEACGGTHLKNTSEAEQIKILKTTKIQDGVVRIIFSAGAASKEIEKQKESILAKTAEILGVEINEIPARAEELFIKWKKARKAIKKGRKLKVEELKLVAKQIYKGDILAKTAEIFKTQPEYIIKTAKRFLDDLKEMREKS